MPIKRIGAIWEIWVTLVRLIQPCLDHPAPFISQQPYITQIADITKVTNWAMYLIIHVFRCVLVRTIFLGKGRRKEGRKEEWALLSWFRDHSWPGQKYYHNPKWNLILNKCPTICLCKIWLLLLFYFENFHCRKCNTFVKFCNFLHCICNMLQHFFKALAMPMHLYHDCNIMNGLHPC